MTVLQKEPSSLTISYKFIRRPDISPELRLRLGVILFCFKQHGQVTGFAEKYEVSRSFLYDLEDKVSAQLSGLFELPQTPEDNQKLRRHCAWEEILDLRLIGKCSLGSISSLLSREETLPNSTCFISQFLKQLGGHLGKTVDWQGEVNFACDEIFMVGHQPILVTVDPISSAILQIELLESLSKEAWEAHWQRLLDVGITPLLMTKDEGTAMNAAQAAGVMKHIKVQTDIFHAIAHRLGLYKKRLEKDADKAMEHEWDRQTKLQNAVSEDNKAKKKIPYQAACQNTLRAIEQFEGFQFLYFHILNQLNIFDSKGQVRQQQTAIEELRIAIQMMRELQIAGLEEQLGTIEKLLPKLFNYLTKAEEVQHELVSKLGQVPTYFWTYAWQSMKKSRKIKNYAKSKAAAQKAEVALELLQEHYQLHTEQFEALKADIFKQLDSIIQSSALVETINSLLRPYMNESKNQLSQEQLNLIRFYLNHRVYKRGKRKGFAPIELLTGHKLDKPWRDMLMEKAIAAA